MAVLTVYCKKCKHDSSLCGFIQRSDLRGTKYENKMNTITDEELDALEAAGEIQDEWDRWDGKCPNCGSEDVTAF